MKTSFDDKLSRV